MYTYKANYKYKLLFLIGSILTLSLIGLGGLEAMIGGFFTSSVMLLIAIVLAYLLLFVFAKEISVWETGIRYTTLIRSMDIDFSQIKDVKPFYTTRSLTLAGGDKEKAAMFCRIRLKDNPSSLLLFGSAINNYKELYSRIHLSVNNMNKVQASS